MKLDNQFHDMDMDHEKIVDFCYDDDHDDHDEEDLEYLDLEEEDDDDDEEKATTTTTQFNKESSTSNLMGTKKNTTNSTTTTTTTPSSTTTKASSSSSSPFVNRVKVFEELIENCKLNCIKESLIQSNEISSNGQMDKTTILMAEKRLNQIIDQLSRLRQRFIQRSESSSSTSTTSSSSTDHEFSKNLDGSASGTSSSSSSSSLFLDQTTIQQQHLQDNINIFAASKIHHLSQQQQQHLTNTGSLYESLSANTIQTLMNSQNPSTFNLENYLHGRSSSNLFLNNLLLSTSHQHFHHQSTSDLHQNQIKLATAAAAAAAAMATTVKNSTDSSTGIAPINMEALDIEKMSNSILNHYNAAMLMPNLLNNFTELKSNPKMETSLKNHNNHHQQESLHMDHQQESTKESLINQLKMVTVIK
nr:uncharacterized protein DDB_G0271670-like [Dermatophagoides farinae]